MLDSLCAATASPVIARCARCFGFARRRSVLAAGLLMSLACGEQGGDASDAGTYEGPPIAVRIEYEAPTQLDARVAAAHPACVAEVGATHLHPSWSNFDILRMRASGDSGWTLESKVPAPGRYSFRISDPNACGTAPHGAVTREAIQANGVLLTRRVSTPGGNGPEPGFAFTIAADGVVTP